MVNLELFKLSKKQMSEIPGGKIVCDISDVGYELDKPKGWKSTSGSITYDNLPDDYDLGKLESMLYDQIGPDIYIYCH